MNACTNAIINVNDDGGKIFLGQIDTLNVRAQQFDLSDWIARFGAGALFVLVLRPGETIPYAAEQVEIENGIATWTFNDADTAISGFGSVALAYLVGDEYKARTKPFKTFVAETIGESPVDPPDPLIGWLERILEASADAQQAASRAAASAQDALQQARRAETQATQANTARIQAVAARDEAQAARGEAVTAAGTATGAAETATTAAGAAQGAQSAAETAQGKAEAAQALAETAQGKAETAQALAETAQGKAETAQALAETAQGKAETAQALAETAQGKAETAQTAAEAAAVEAKNTVLAAFATETQNNVSTVETDVAADNLPIKALTIDIGAAQEGSGDPSPSNVRPISARETVNVIVSPTAEAAAGTTYQIALVSSGTYLAQLDVVTGMLMVIGTKILLDGSTRKLSFNTAFDQSTHGKVFYFSESGSTHSPPLWSHSLIKSNKLTYTRNYNMPLYSYGLNRGAESVHCVCLDRSLADAEAANAWLQSIGGIEVVVPLVTTRTYQCTPTEVRSVYGTMKLWNESGTVNKAVYRLDPTLVYNSLRGG